MGNSDDRRIATSPPAPLRDGEGSRMHGWGGNLLRLPADNQACPACSGPGPSLRVLCGVVPRLLNGCFGRCYAAGRSCTPNSVVSIPSDLSSSISSASKHASSSKQMAPLTSPSPCVIAAAMLGLPPRVLSSFVYPTTSSCTIPTASLTRSIVSSLRIFRLPSPSRRGAGGIGAKRQNCAGRTGVDHPLPLGEGWGEGTAFACRIEPRAQSPQFGDFSVRLTGSFALTPRPLSRLRR